MPVFKRRTRPEPWARHRTRARHGWLVPLYGFEWGWTWVAYWLSGWAFLEVLEYLGTLSILIAVISYFAESGDRVKQKHYQAWQVINSAQSKGGSGGRIEALEELAADKVPLVGVDVSGAFLMGIDLGHANLLRANLSAADMRNCKLVRTGLQYATLASTNLRGGDLQRADLREADLEDADLNGASLAEADLENANLTRADLRRSDWRDARWRKISSMKQANVFGIQNAPPGFIEWARQQGAVAVESDSEWLAMLQHAGPNGG
ncbi:MAG: pentapeptide repeat-containing protein [Verrucomicrobia bacterium]|nr:pentapeptide repeat-containing protein [Verrucomicrobiota bacterium]